MKYLLSETSSTLYKTIIACPLSRSTLGGGGLEHTNFSYVRYLINNDNMGFN